MAARSGLGKPTTPTDTHPNDPDGHGRGRESARDRGVHPAGDRRNPITERFHRSTVVDHVRGGAVLHRGCAGAGNVLDHPTDGACPAMGDRGTPADAGGRAQHIPGRVASGRRRPDSVGIRSGPADDSVWHGQHHVHPTVSVRRDILRGAGRHRQLSAHRICLASGRGSGVGGGTAATAIVLGHHGPNHDGVAAWFCVRSRLRRWRRDRRHGDCPRASWAEP
ncbi:hypothetical protein KST_00942 [Mycobacterium marinum]|nr:hypothetical protein KST_00942 [Mycobacterium marinum]